MKQLHEQRDADKWKELIDSTNEAAETLERKAAKLRRAIKTFEECIAKGQPWPTSKKNVKVS